MTLLAIRSHRIRIAICCMADSSGYEAPAKFCQYSSISTFRCEPFAFFQYSKREHLAISEENDLFGIRIRLDKLVALTGSGSWRSVPYGIQWPVIKRL